MDIEPGTPCEAYWNLHKKVYSVRSRRSEDYGRVIAHVDSFVLSDVEFVVREAGRQKVLKEHRKNVHAFVRGVWTSPDASLQGASLSKVSYNPYRDQTFVVSDEIATKAIRVAWTAMGVTVPDTRTPRLFARV